MEARACSSLVQNMELSTEFGEDSCSSLRCLRRNCLLWIVMLKKAFWHRCKLASTHSYDQLRKNKCSTEPVVEGMAGISAGCTKGLTVAPYSPLPVKAWQALTFE